MSVAAGQVVTVTVEKPAAGGRMLARVGGQVLLVSGAVPGERVRARVERVGRGMAFAETTEVEEPSPDRRAVPADPLCGGCLYNFIAYPRQLQLKAQVVADAFIRIGRITLPGPVAVAGSPEEGYRMRARLHVRGARVGFFRENTHDLCDARGTRQLLSATCDALDRLAAGLGGLGRGAVRELDVSENIDGSARAVHLEADAPVDPAAFSALLGDDGITGLSLGVLGQPGLASGNPYVSDTLTIEAHAVSLRRHVLAFFQGNRFLVADLTRHVMTAISRGEEVLDLYAGVGLFACAAAIVRGARVTAVEGDRVAAADLEENARAAAPHVEAVHQAVEAFTGRSRTPPAVVIVDPPRTGLSREALDGAVRLKAPTFVYVSCDVATLARDVRRLVDGGYVVERVDGFDLFPNTPHVETVVVLRRR